MSKVKKLIIIASAALASCGSQPSDGAAPVTLYRNSSVDPGLRVHWATFDAEESDRSYNLNNCQMASRLLNANVDAFARAEGKERDSKVGFWCEPGGYSEEGRVPASFPSAFPTDVP